MQSLGATPTNAAWNSSSASIRALVFCDHPGAGNEKSVAEAISHEAGHNMGLHHDGTSTTGHYQGHGSGVTGWAPIMGVGGYQYLPSGNIETSDSATP